MRDLLENENPKTDVVRILLVEDSVFDAELAMLNLQQANLPVQFYLVKNEEEYLNALNEPFDLILSDWSLPGFSGLRALNIRNELGLDTPFIINSGNIGEEAAVEAIHLGAADYVWKDRPKRLPQAVVNALEKKREQQARKNAEDLVRLQSLALNAAANSIIITDHLGVVEWANPAFCQLSGYSMEEVIGKSVGEMLIPENFYDPFMDETQQTLQEGKTWQGSMVNRRKDGSLFYVEQTITPMLDASGKIQKFVTIEQDITERREKEIELVKQHARLCLLYEAGKRLSQHLDRQHIYHQFYQLIKKAMVCDSLVIADYLERNQTFAVRFAIEDGKEVEVGSLPPLPMLPGSLSPQSLQAPIVFQKEIRGIIQIKSNQPEAYDDDDLQIVRSLANQIAIIGNNAKLYEKSLREIEYRKQIEAMLVQVNFRQEKIAALAHDLSASMDIRQICKISKRYLAELIDSPFFMISAADGLSNEIRPIFLGLDDLDVFEDSYLLDKMAPLMNFPARQGAIDFKTPINHTDLAEFNNKILTIFPNRRKKNRSAFCAPMVVEGEVIGVIDLMSVRENAYDNKDRDWLSIVANLIGTVLRNTNLYLNLQRRMGELAALHEIDLAVISRDVMNNPFDEVINQIKIRLEVDAANILLFDPHEEELTFFAGFGFYSQKVKNTRLKLGQGLAGRCAVERRLIHTPEEGEEQATFADIGLWRSEGFVTSYSIPLIVKEKLLGVLAVFKRTRFSPDQDWLLFFGVLASQLAIVLDYLSTITDLQNVNQELLAAYEATIEGWSLAMDLRDHETEGHTQRVTQLTLDLARNMGFEEDGLVHICRGALLHDIGKLGVPDRILLKEGPLTDEEWALMKKHPVYAYEMIRSIDYLAPAIDIPYYHHERWDGSGYPHGLSGEDIPLAARIFAVVDVWDALISDRPYRAAWSADKAIKYIQDQAGKQFDPQVVKLFLQHMQDNQFFVKQESAG